MTDADLRVGAIGCRTFRVGMNDAVFRPLMFDHADHTWAQETAVAQCRLVGVAGTRITGTTIIVTVSDQPSIHATNECTCARCAQHRANPIPETCQCGLYSAAHGQFIAQQYPMSAMHCLVVVEPHGYAMEGSRGWRSQYSTILAAWVNPQTVPSTLIDRVAKRYTRAAFHASLADLFAAFPSIDDGTGVDGYREALQPRSIHMGTSLAIDAIR